MKSLLAIFLASTMLLSLNAPAFAEETHEITTNPVNIYLGSMDTGIPVPLQNQ